MEMCTTPTNIYRIDAQNNDSRKLTKVRRKSSRLVQNYVIFVTFTEPKSKGIDAVADGTKGLTLYFDPERVLERIWRLRRSKDTQGICFLTKKKSVCYGSSVPLKAKYTYTDATSFFIIIIIIIIIIVWLLFTSTSRK